MQFSSFFSASVLNEGKRLFQKGAVDTPVEIAPGKWSVHAGIFPIYSVELIFRNNILTMMGCSCPDAKAGIRCVHEAAALFALEFHQMHSHSAPAPAKRQRVQPFAHPPKGYQYFNFPRLTRNLIIYDDTYRCAQSILSQDKLLKQSLHTFLQPGGVGHCCRVILHDEKAPDGILVDVNYDKEQLWFSSDCSCRQLNSTPCVHRVAALIALYNSLESFSVGDATDTAGFSLLHEFDNLPLSASNTLPAEKEHLSLKPCLALRPIEGDEKLVLSFRTGRSRLLKVRDTGELISAYLENGSVELGKTQTISFATQTYAGKDLDYFNLLRDLDYDATPVNGLAGAYELEGSGLDTFFEIGSGDAIPFSAGSGAESELTLSVGSPRLSLTLTPLKEKSVLHGIHLEGKCPPLFQGSRHLYVLTADTLYRLPEENSPLAALLKSAKDRDISLDIGRDNLPRFYRTILPALQLCADITETAPEEIQQILPPLPVFTFYLDLKGSTALCQVKLTYGDRVCHLIDAANDRLLLEPFRDRDAEKKVLRLTETYFPRFVAESQEHSTEGSEEALYLLLTEGIPALEKAGDVMVTDAFKRLKVRPKVAVNVGVSVSGNMTRLTVKSELSGDELLQVLQSYREKKKYHLLSNGDFLPLDNGVSSLAELQDKLHISDKSLRTGEVNLPAYRALYADRLLEESTDLVVERSARLRQLSRDFKTVNDAEFEVPASFNGTLRSYQVFGYKWLRTLEHFSFGGILADDMGLGKTIQVIAFLLSAKEEGRLTRALVVCPASVVYNWQDELRRFAPTLTSCVVSGDNRSRLIGAVCDVLITSYDTLRRDIELYRGNSFSHQIVDEAQNIKNQSTAAAKAVKEIQASFRLAMTGTPIENRLSELWSVFDYVMPGYLFSYESFRLEYELPIAKDGNKKAARQLRNQVAPFILRRMKKDVLTDLPDKMEITRYAVMEDTQRKIYDARVQRLIRSLEQESDEDFRNGKLQVLAELTKLRQLCCDPSLLLEDYDGPSAKREECMRLIENAMEGGHRMLVFSQFTSMLTLLAAELDSRGISYYTITGDTPKETRLQLVKDFNSGTVPVFLISLKAGGTGLNLVGADTVIHYDPWWNVAAQNQASDRVYRIGQKNDVTVYKLIARDTIEEKIQQLQESKQRLADAVLGDSSAVNLSSLTREELLSLFEQPENK